MKNGMKWRISCFLLAISLLLGGLWLTGETWAWESMSELNGGRLTVGTVDYALKILQEEQALPNGVLEPGTYTVTLTAVGDIDGWFWVTFYPLEGEMEEMVMRTRRMQPGESLSFTLKLAGRAWLTVQSRWDGLWMSLPEITEGMEIPFGSKAAQSATEPPATEAVQPATEPPATEVAQPTTQPPATEVAQPTTQPPETEAAQPTTEPPETETSVPETGTTEP